MVSRPRAAAGLALALAAGAGALAAQEEQANFRPGICSELKERARPRHEAEKIWRLEPDIRARELADRVGVDRKKARDWIERWARPGAAERDCKLYPSAKTVSSGVGAAEAGRADPAMRSFLKRLSDDERQACGPRLEACFYFIVDCRLPPRLRRMGRRMPAISPPRWVRTTAGECKIKAGKFQPRELADRPAPAAGEAAAASPFRLVLRYGDGAEREISPPRRRAEAAARPLPESAWEEDARLGKACAQNYLGEIHLERREYRRAHEWFVQAAEKDHPRALINLGTLYERGLGVEAEPLAALDCYAAATGDETVVLAEIDPNLPPAVRREIKTRATAAKKLQGPTIEVIDPWLSYRRPRVKIDQESETRRLAGRIFALATIESFELIRQAGTDEEDSERVKLNGFEFDHTVSSLPAEQEEFQLKLSVRDEQGKVKDVDFELVRGEVTPRRPSGEGGSGSYHALVIGIDKYAQGAVFPALEAPVLDARGVHEQLDKRWGFDSVTLLDGAAKLESIVKELDRLRRDLRPEDSLLIYFAGHGEYRKDAFDNQDGFWIPYDATDDQLTWLSSRQIAHQLETIQAGNILVLADACFSGFLTRTTISAKAGSRSVSVLTSADETKALDLGTGENSPFARAVIEVLETWNEELPASRLETRVVAAFEEYGKSCAKAKAEAAKASGDEEGAFCAALEAYGQKPQFQAVAEGGHQGGEFVFVLAAP